MQAILDHYGLGRITDEKKYQAYSVARTPQGEFIVMDCGDSVQRARSERTNREHKLTTVFGEIELCRLADYQGVLHDESSYVHQDGRYYAVYKIAKRS